MARLKEDAEEVEGWTPGTGLLRDGGGSRVWLRVKRLGVEPGNVDDAVAAAVVGGAPDAEGYCAMMNEIERLPQQLVGAVDAAEDVGVFGSHGVTADSQGRPPSETEPRVRSVTSQFQPGWSAQHHTQFSLDEPGCFPCQGIWLGVNYDSFNGTT